MGEVHRLPAPQVSFSLQTAGRLMTKIFPQWVQDLALLVESVETVRPPGALPDWQPGAIVRLPYSRKLCGDGAAVCTQALMALADTAMVLACSAAWNGYRPMTSIDQTTHFLRPVNFDVIADARAVRLGRNASFGRVMLLNAADGRPVGMVASAYGRLWGSEYQKQVANIASEAYHLLTVRYFASPLEALPWFKNWFENP